VTAQGIFSYLSGVIPSIYMERDNHGMGEMNGEKAGFPGVAETEDEP
jgi:hypothetical protein